MLFELSHPGRKHGGKTGMTLKKYLKVNPGPLGVMGQGGKHANNTERQPGMGFNLKTHPQ